MADDQNKPYAGRGGEKLKFSIEQMSLSVRGMVAADFGCNIGGFTDCLLREGANRVYAVDTGYGMLEWRLRKDARVVVMERTNAMHVQLPELVDIVTVDVAWTKQRLILPNALRQLKSAGILLSLFKPQYEAAPSLVRRGKISDSQFEPVLTITVSELERGGIKVHQIVRLPRWKDSKNPEAILYIWRSECVVT